MGVTIRHKSLPAGTYDAGDYSVERLERYAKNTNEAIARGFTVPLIDRHVDLDNLADDSALRTCGMVKKVFVEGGQLGYELDVIDGEVTKRLTVLKTSPEFREERKYNGFGTLGPHIRHVALTSKPRNQFQGPFEIVSEGVSRFYEDNDMADENEKVDDEATSEVDAENVTETTAPTEEVNPDLPKDDKASQVMEAVVAQLNAIGIGVPAGWSFESDGAADVLLAALKTYQMAQASAEPEKEEEAEAPQVSESESPVVFSEDELSALPKHIQAALRRAKNLESKVARFSEEKATVTKEKTVAKVRQLLHNLPALRDQMLAKFEAVQFSESLDEVSAARLEAIEAFAAALPPNLRFSEDGVTVANHQEGDKFFQRQPGETTDEEAEAIVNQMFTRGKAATA